MEALEYRKLDGLIKKTYEIQVSEFPNECPICHIVQTPQLVEAFETAKDRIEIIFRCNGKDCKRLFISRVKAEAWIQGYADKWILKESYPVHSQNKVFESEIKEISSGFVEIYNQAKQSEEMGLNHVAGMGYRKSLEFLIKDFLISFRDEDEEKIKNTFLGNCINKHLTGNVKHVAERATWLGNDETHYQRVWEGKDISDLKKLIDLTIYYIASEIQTQKIIVEMDRKK